MLVLSRQKNEAIMIGNDVEIVVVDIRGDRVRLGITAPQQVPVHRKEIYEAIKHENIEASRTGAADLGQLDELLRGTKKPPKEDKGDTNAKPEREKKKEDKTGPGQDA